MLYHHANCYYAMYTNVITFCFISVTLVKQCAFSVSELLRSEDKETEAQRRGKCLCLPPRHIRFGFTEDARLLDSEVMIFDIFNGLGVDIG